MHASAEVFRRTIAQPFIAVKTYEKVDESLGQRKQGESLDARWYVNKLQAGRLERERLAHEDD